MNRRNLFLSIFVLLMIFMNFVSTVHAARIYTGNSAVAIGGYDAVSYQNTKGPEMGKSEYSADWNGAKWYFVSPSNRDAFAQQPENYAPQYGGYCAFAVSKNALAPGDPAVWKMVDGKLYLNLNKSVQAMWESDQQNLILRADQNWPDLSK